MSSSAVHDINEQFIARLTRPDKKIGRPINPFARISSKRTDTLNSEISAVMKLGAEYQGKIVDNRTNGGVYLETYAIQDNPKAGTTKYTTNRMPVEHTREK